MMRISMLRQRPCSGWFLFLVGISLFLTLQVPAWARPMAPCALSGLTQESPEITNEWCPVLTDEPVDPELSMEYRGVRVFLCCKKCLKQFRADPEAYASNVPALVAQATDAETEEHGADAGDHEGAETAEHGHASDGGEEGEHDHSDHGDNEATGLAAMIRWLGRLHPAVVHFPIGLLFMAAVAELLAICVGSTRLLFAARFCLWGGALGALAAAPLGWMGAVSVEESYVGFAARLLLFHRWLGVATAVCAALALYSCERSWRVEGSAWKRPYRILLFLSAALVSVVGHLGGSLIYGWEYLSW